MNKLLDSMKLVATSLGLYEWSYLACEVKHCRENTVIPTCYDFYLMKTLQLSYLEADRGAATRGIKLPTQQSDHLLHLSDNR